jgi:hypothetical protein
MFDLATDFDINAAFQEAIHGVATDTEIALEEKVRRMEVIVSEGTSEVYRDFVDFRSMGAQVEMFCNHDHAFNQATQGSETLSSFMDGHKEDGHNHGNDTHDKHGHKKGDDDEIDPKTGKKKKKRYSGWLGWLSMRS